MKTYKTQNKVLKARPGRKKVHEEKRGVCRKVSRRVMEKLTKLKKRQP